LPVRMLHHQLPVVGFRFGKIGYLTDFTQISDSELAKLNGVDILIIEALRQYPHIAHISLPQALEYIEKINPSRSYLIHMNHQFGRHEEIQKILPENVVIAYDGLSFEIN
ncbi:MAG: MBL fold metallo-hydrolase, partial [Bacteroidales bacterium]